MKRINTTIFFIISILAASSSFAHGEDKAGPNGGFIKMPGAFHTEVVPENSNKIKIYLLDMEWKNPTLKDSSIEAAIKIGKKNSKLSCQAQTDFYACDLPKGINLKKGQLEIQPVRQGQSGNKAIYKLPLTLESEKKQTDSHEGHH